MRFFFLFYFILLAHSQSQLTSISITQPKQNARVSHTESLDVIVVINGATQDFLLSGSLACPAANSTWFDGLSQDWSTDSDVQLEVPAQTIWDCKNSKLHMYFTLVDSRTGVVANVLDFPVRVIGFGLSKACIICSTLSAFSCAFLLVLYLGFPFLRAFPSNLIGWRTAADLLVSVTQLAVHTAGMTLTQDMDHLCHPVGAFLTEFGLIASISMFAVLGFNFYACISNPWMLPASRKWKYAAVVLVLATVLSPFTARYSEFRDDFQLCWSSRESGINNKNWGLFWVWLFLADAIAIVFCTFGYFKFKTHRSIFSSANFTIIRHNFFYVVVFTVYWTVIGGIWFDVYLTSDSDDDIIPNDALSFVFPVLFSLMGFINATTWLSLKGSQLWRKLCCWNQAEKQQVEEVEEVGEIYAGLRSQFLQRFWCRLKKVLEEEPPPVDDWENNEHDFTAYAPRQFSELRKEFGLEKFSASFKTAPDATQFSEGGSGSFLFFSFNNKYVIKNISSSELDVLLSILPAYTDYMKDRASAAIYTYLPLLCGAYRLTMYEQTHYLLVTNNIFASETGSKIEFRSRFDLKGSKVNRSETDETKVGKDLDWRRQLAIHLPQEKSGQVQQALLSDINFLRQQNIMDYSLLVGMCYSGYEPADDPRSPTSSHSESLDPLPEAKGDVPDAYLDDPSHNNLTINNFSTAQGDPGWTRTARLRNKMRKFWNKYRRHMNLDEKQGEAVDRECEKLLLATEEGLPMNSTRAIGTKKQFGVSHAVRADILYNFGIVDILQKWNWKKCGEHYVKRFLTGHWCDAEQISAIRPGPYAERFIREVLRRVFLRTTLPAASAPASAPAVSSSSSVSSAAPSGSPSAAPLASASSLASS